MTEFTVVCVATRRYPMVEHLAAHLCIYSNPIRSMIQAFFENFGERFLRIWDGEFNSFSSLRLSKQTDNFDVSYETLVQHMSTLEKKKNI